MADELDLIDDLKTRFAIPAPVADDDAVSQYQDIETQRETVAVDNFMNDVDDAAPVEDPQDPMSQIEPAEPVSQNVSRETEDDETGGGVLDTVGNVGADVVGGLVEAPRQALGGVGAALGEVEQALTDVFGDLGTIQITDPETGEFDLQYLTGDEADERRKVGDDPFSLLASDEADTVTGSFVRSTSQFLVGFIPAAKGLKAAGVTKGALTTAMAGGAIADAVVFDPNEDRLSTWLNEVPALEPFVSDYLADAGQDDSHWEGRFKNAVEGLGLGLAADGTATLFKALKYYKAQRKAAKLEADPVGAHAEAGRDALKQSAREELIEDVPDEAFLPLGDENAPAIVEALPNETSDLAFKRITEAAKRSELAIERKDALGKINRVREQFAAKVSPEALEAGRDPMDDLIDGLRSGAGAPVSARISRPAAGIIKKSGGIDPKSSIAAELKARDITPRTHPGMFKKGGMKSLDTFPIEEHRQFEGKGYDDGNGYVSEQGWIDALEAEAGGNPFRSPEEQIEFDEYFAPIADFDEQMNRLGIDVSELSNEQIKARIKDIAQEEVDFARTQEEIPEGAVARTADDIADESEQIAEGAVVNQDPNEPPKRKIFINHARMKTADDVKEVMQQMIDSDADAINAKRGGEVVTNEQTKAASKKEFQSVEDLLGRPPGAMTAAQAVAARELLTASGEQLVDLARRAQDPKATKADLYNFRRGMAVHYAIQSEVVAARTETARALQSWSIPAGAGKQRSQAINDLIVQNGGGGDIQSLAKAVTMVGDNPTALNTMASELGRGRFGRAAYQVWINGLLSSPKTHVVNVTSNAMVAVWAIPERYLASGISKTFYAGEIEAGEVASQAFGLAKGIRDGIRLVYQGNKAADNGDIGDIFDAFGKVENHGNDISAEAFGLNSQGAFGRGIDMLGKVVNAPGSMLQVEDKFFKSVGYRMELNALAYRTAAGEGLEGKEFAERVAGILNDPPADLKAEALDVAHYQTFTNELGKVGQGVQEFVRNTPGLRLVVPFIRTPTNILKYTFSRTPLAYMSGKIRADIKAGGARAATAHARVAMGSMAMLTIADMTAEGTITGKGSLDPALRRAKMQTGWKPYSIKVGDRWYQYSRTDPIGMIMGLGADIAELSTNADGNEGEMLVTAGVLALANNMASKTYMRGVYDFIGAIDPSNPTNTPTKYISDFAGSIVPYSSFLRNVTSSTDTTVRETRDVIRDGDEVDEVATFLNDLVNKQMKVIPGMSDELPPMRDMYGEPIDRASGLGWGWDFLSPIASSVDNPDPATQVIIDNQIKINRAPRVVKGVRLNAEEYDQYSKIAGQFFKEEIDILITDPNFQSQSEGADGMKSELIRDLWNTSKKIAAEELFNESERLQDIQYSNELKKIKNLQGETQ